MNERKEFIFIERFSFKIKDLLLLKLCFECNRVDSMEKYFNKKEEFLIKRIQIPLFPKLISLKFKKLPFVAKQKLPRL